MPKVLLVDDNQTNREMLARRLSRTGIEVLVASDGIEGVEMTTSMRPDLVLMDIGMPRMDGYEATRALKANEETRAIPVIALTAHATTEDQQKARAAGCEDYESKPVDFTRLVEKIKRYTAT